MWTWIKNLFKRKQETPVIALPEVEIKTDKSIIVKPEMLNELLNTCKYLTSKKWEYLAVEAVTGVPWRVVAACHYRECSMNFNQCLHNGDPWNKVTVHVPKGRGPFNSWHESAIDAMMIEKNKFPIAWDLAGQLDFCERYNGLGYRNRGVVSPYVYAGTNMYTSGLYVADGKYDPSKIDKRLGCAAIIVSL